MSLCRRKCSLIVAVLYLAHGDMVVGAPTVKNMRYRSHWAGEDEPWADIKVTVTPPDNGAALPSVARVRLDTVYVLGTRRDLFCHIENYFTFSSLSNVDGAGWNALATETGTTTGCPNGARPTHVVEFEIPLPAGDGQHSLAFHIYSDGRDGFCPRPNSVRKASLRVSGTISWNSASGTLQAATVLIDNLAQPRDLSGCPAANSQNDRFPDRVIDRPANLTSGPRVYADSSNTGRKCCANGCRTCPSPVAVTSSPCSCKSNQVADTRPRRFVFLALRCRR